jgi:hypothetical protein
MSLKDMSLKASISDSACVRHHIAVGENVQCSLIWQCKAFYEVEWSVSAILRRLPGDTERA